MRRIAAPSCCPMEFYYPLCHSEHTTMSVFVGLRGAKLYGSKHDKHLEKYGADRGQTWLRSAYMSQSDYDKWIAEVRKTLAGGKSWLDMYQLLAKACAETKAAGWKLRRAMRNTLSFEQMAEGAILKERRLELLYEATPRKTKTLDMPLARKPRCEPSPAKAPSQGESLTALQGKQIVPECPAGT